MGLAIEVTERIKKILRARNLTYKDLATHFGLSESAFKRAFAKGEFSLSRLEAICRFLEISLQDLASVNRRFEKVDFLTEDQELALSVDEALFVIFYLVLSGISLPNIVQRFNFTSQEVEKHLIALDKLKLVNLLPQNRVQPLVTQSFWWDPRGPLSQKYYPIIKPDFVSSRFDEQNEANWFVSGKITEESLATFRKKLNRTVAELRELIELDEADSAENKVNITFFAGYRPWALPILSRYAKSSSERLQKS